MIQIPLEDNKLNNDPEILGLNRLISMLEQQRSASEASGELCEAEQHQNNETKERIELLQELRNDIIDQYEKINKYKQR